MHGCSYQATSLEVVQMKCSINGCTKPAHSRTWCHAHYKKWHLHGDPNHGRSYARGRGEGTVNWAGYLAVMVGAKKRLQHVVVAEKVLGKPLPPRAVVHHVDGDRLNNEPANLVVCPDPAYHQLLHVRQRAMDECGNPAFRRCIFCRFFGDVSLMTKTGNNKSGHHHYHKGCRAKAEHERTHSDHHV
jgi:hypothetical protein